MPSRFVVTAFHGDTSEKVGEFEDAVKLALAMWELGLQRPEFDSIQVQELPVPEVQLYMGYNAKCVEYLSSTYKCPKEMAVRALHQSEGSVVHAGTLLSTVGEILG